jgi:3-deoxy-manno-octulosonate cytidylyltransferase (CMP-KDO synthetase)
MFCLFCVPSLQKYIVISKGSSNKFLKMKVGIIPARFASTRFPGKPLVDIGGKSMIQRVYEGAQRATLLDRVVVATDDQRIFEHVQSWGGWVLMTGSGHVSGTDRVAEAALDFSGATCVVNIQGDEPFVHPEQIDLLVQGLDRDAAVDIVTLAIRITDAAQLFHANTVKVVCDSRGDALYFSRHPLPYHRGSNPEGWLDAHPYLKHLGMYGFRPSVLRAITALPPSPLEVAESLEQLRWLENGYRVRVLLTERETVGIDTPEDLDKLTAHLG